MLVSTLYFLFFLKGYTLHLLQMPSSVRVGIFLPRGQQKFRNRCAASVHIANDGRSPWAGMGIDRTKV